jgi:Protein of unknown function (DUF1214)
MDEATKRGLARAAGDGRKLLQEIIASGDLGGRINGWSFPARAIGRAGNRGRLSLARISNLKRDPDGGLTIYIQAASPGQDKETNWLPSTKSGPMFVIVRTYMPDKEIVEQKWQIPGIIEVK